MTAADPVSARGLLGLFADQQPSPVTAPATHVEIPSSPVVSDVPVAFVSDIKGVGNPEIRRFDFAHKGQRIDLGRNGEILLTFFSPCRVERITGGLITLTDSEATVSMDASRQTQGASCRPMEDLPPFKNAQSRLPDEGPFDQTAWAEAVVNSRPVFKWPPLPPGTVGNVTVWALDHIEPEIVWQTATPLAYAEYPAASRPLTPGLPYLVEVSIAGEAVVKARFSLDLDLSFSKTALNRVIWLDVEKAPST
ncbi:MAG: hypothetical protein ACE363_05795 [Alphaproteobacteria bacterium]